MIGVTRDLRRLSPAAIHSGGKRRPVVIELIPPGDVIGFRLLGTRKAYLLPVGHCFQEAVRIELAARKREKAAILKERKKART